jgi:hypothetical protein
VNRIFRILFRPGVEWESIAGESTTVATLVVAYVVPLSLLPSIATVIGVTYFGTAWSPVHGYALPGERALAVGAANFLFLVMTILLLALIFHWFAIAETKARNSFTDALKVATYGAIPTLLAGTFLVLPVMVMLCIVAFLHSLYLYNGGLKKVLRVSETEAPILLGIAMMMLCVTSMAIGAITAALGLL